MAMKELTKKKLGLNQVLVTYYFIAFVVVIYFIFLPTLQHVLFLYMKFILL